MVKAKEIEEKLSENGYTKIDRGLVVFGGRNNGTVDIKATNPRTKKAIILEIKSAPLHVYDVAQFIALKNNIERHKKSGEKIKYFILATEKEVFSPLINMAKEKNIQIVNINNFLECLPLE